MKRMFKGKTVCLIFLAAFLSAGFVFANSGFAQIPVYRFYSDGLKTHLYTVDENEKSYLENQSAWVYEGVAWNAYATQEAGTLPVYRFYSDKTSVHFYTMNENEKAALMSGSTWFYEGVAYYAYPSANSGATPIYRLYNESSKRHLFTADTDEASVLDAGTDWRGEGIAWYAGGGGVTPPSPTVCSGGALYDDFSGSALDPNKWIWKDYGDLEYVQEVSDGRLNLHVRGVDRRSTVGPMMPLHRYVETKAMIKSGSQLSPGAFGIARLGAEYYNDSFGPGSGSDYNGEEGQIWAENRLLLLDDGTLFATARIYRSDNADFSEATELFKENFQTPINFDTYYTISIEFTGTELIFKCDGEIFTYAITTPTYDGLYPYIQLRSRVYADPGESGYMKVAFDYVCAQ
jgi:hypothetical protein